MLHSILTSQNSAENIILLKASAVAYKEAKTKEFLITYTLLFLALAYPVAYIFKLTDFKNILFYISFAATAVGWFLSDAFKGNTLKGALLKEEFDRKIFSMSWNFIMNKVEDLEREGLAKQFNVKNDSVENWYPINLSPKLSDFTAIALCQRISCSWDLVLRKKMQAIAWGILFIYFLFVVIVVFNAIKDGSTLFLLIFSLSSFISHALTFLKGNKTAIEKRQNIITKIDSKLNTFNDDFSPTQLRDIQDELFRVRQEQIKVPEFLCRKNKKEIYSTIESYVESINTKRL